MSTYYIVYRQPGMVSRSRLYEGEYVTREAAQRVVDKANQGDDAEPGVYYWEVARIADDKPAVRDEEDLDPVSDDMLSDSDHAWDDVPSTLRSSQQPATEEAPEGKRFLTMEDLRAAVNKVTTQTHEWRIGSHRVHVDRNIIVLNGVQVTREQATALTFALSDALKATAA